MTASFGELRSLFEQPPGQKPWRRLLRALDLMDQPDHTPPASAMHTPLEAAVHYCARALSRWPSDLERPLPAGWMFDPQTGMPRRPAHPGVVLGTSLEVVHPLIPKLLRTGPPQSGSTPTLRALRIHQDAKLTPQTLLDLWPSPTFSPLHTLCLPRLSLSTAAALTLTRAPSPAGLLSLQGGLTFESIEAMKLFGRQDHLPHLAHLECTLGDPEPMELHRAFAPGHFGALESLSLRTRHLNHLVSHLSHHSRPWKRLHLSGEMQLACDLHLLQEHAAFVDLQELTLRGMAFMSHDALGFLCGAGLPRLDTLTLTEAALSTDAWLLLMEHAQLPHLRHLDLSMPRGIEMQRADLPGRLLHSPLLPRLQTLWMDHVPMPGALLDALLQNAAALTSLSLSASLGSHQGLSPVLSHLAGMPGLCRLDLSYNALPTPALHALLDHTAPLTLQELQVHHNTRVLDDWVTRLLTQHPELEVLSLDASSLSRQALDALAHAAHHGQLSHLILHQKHRPPPFDQAACARLLDSGLRLQWEP